MTENVAIAVECFEALEKRKPDSERHMKDVLALFADNFSEYKQIKIAIECRMCEWYQDGYCNHDECPY